MRGRRRGSPIAGDPPGRRLRCLAMVFILCLGDRDLGARQRAGVLLGQRLRAARVAVRRRGAPRRQPEPDPERIGPGQAKPTLSILVFCMEAGRWPATSCEFGPRVSVHPTLGRAAKPEAARSPIQTVSNLASVAYASASTAKRPGRTSHGAGTTATDATRTRFFERESPHSPDVPGETVGRRPKTRPQSGQHQLTSLRSPASPE
jgi:hypothetical protein